MKKLVMMMICAFLVSTAAGDFAFSAPNEKGGKSAKKHSQVAKKKAKKHAKKGTKGNVKRAKASAVKQVQSQ